MNWGTKIAIVYISFVLFIVFMVYMAFGQQYDLVTEDYYAEEIKYQEVIDSKKRADLLEDQLTVSIDAQQMKVKFPQKNARINGKIQCFRPSDQSKDFEVVLNNNQGVESIPLEKFSRGKYLLKVSWEVDSLEYYQEQIVIVP